jgi:hypothetical protein
MLIILFIFLYFLFVAEKIHSYLNKRNAPKEHGRIVEIKE